MIHLLLFVACFLLGNS